MSEVQTFQMEWAGKQLEVTIGKVAAQAHGACMVRYGDTTVLATVVQGAAPRDGVDYFPLLVDFEEKMYAAGKIKGSRFVKREGRPSDEAVLTARLIDRSLRPMFDESERRDLQVVITMLTFDGINDPDIPALVAASCALEISPIVWEGPVSAVRIGRINDEWVVNPSYEAREKSVLDLVVAGTEAAVVMIEAGAAEVDDTVMTEAFTLAHKHLKKVFPLLTEIREKVGKQKLPVTAELDAGMEQEQQSVAEKVKQFFVTAGVESMFPCVDKAAYKAKVSMLSEQLDTQLKHDNKVSKDMRVWALKQLDHHIGEVARDMVLTKGIRVDGRALDELRPLQAEAGVLPRIHGSGLFGRGETQALSIVTLGSPGDQQLLDTMEFEGKKRYIHHYNFPGFSVGEVKPNRGPGRREIGHGALAEKALVPVLPNKDDFPYTMLVVTEIMSSNGSTSQASVCGSTLALMDAGVPITAPVAGISIGLMTNPADHSDYRLLTDIQGLEDHVGDMDFKVAGTTKGITAIQLDIKLLGISLEVCAGAVAKAREARMKILEVMQSAIAQPRADLSPYAPRIQSFYIKPDKIRDVIGSGGKTIREIIDTTGVDIDIEDDGLVMVTSENAENMQKAVDWIQSIVKEVEAGEVYTGKVTRLMDFGAFVEILPGKEGLVHISEIAWERIAKVDDVLNVGDTVEVKVKEIDEMGRINLSRKALLARPENYNNHDSGDDQRHNNNHRSSHHSRPRSPRPQRPGGSQHMA